jgi:hypothetical protein
MGAGLRKRPAGVDRMGRSGPNRTQAGLKVINHLPALIFVQIFQRGPPEHNSSNWVSNFEISHPHQAFSFDF